jgi:hypothetical protein
MAGTRVVGSLLNVWQWLMTSAEAEITSEQMRALYLFRCRWVGQYWSCIMLKQKELVLFKFIREGRGIPNLMSCIRSWLVGIQSARQEKVSWWTLNG